MMSELWKRKMALWSHSPLITSKVSRKHLVQSKRFASLLCSFLVVSAMPAKSHIHHVSMTEMHCQKSTSTCEIALQVPIEATEAQLSLLAGKRVSVEDPASFKKAVFKYIQARFVIRNQSKKVTPLRWIGTEPEMHDSWIYLEATIDDLQAVTLENTLFFDVSKKQVNTVNLYENGSARPRTFHFSEKGFKKSLGTSKSPPQKK
jgi:hypothetical protein